MSPGGHMEMSGDVFDCHNRGYRRTASAEGSICDKWATSTMSPW